MIVVHHLEDSRSQRVLWLLEELGTPYEIKRYRRDPKTKLAPRELLAVHPLGKSPVIVDGDLTTGPAASMRRRARRTGSNTPTGCTSRKAPRCRRPS
jgi:glutathione S-transferase